MTRIFEIDPLPIVNNFSSDLEALRPPKGGDESARYLSFYLISNFEKIVSKIAGTLVSPFRGSGGFKVSIIALLLTINLTAYSNTDSEALFNAANTAFQNKQYDEAIQQYETILKNGLVSKEVYFNLGNCFYKKNKIGKAILNYERALLLESNDKEVLHNLEIAKEQRVDEIEALPDFFLAKWWKSIRQLMSSGGWSFLGILSLWAGIGGLVLWLLGKTREHRKKGFAYGLGLVILSFLPFALSYSSYNYSKNSKNAIILNNQISLKSGADEASTEILKINEGTKVNIQEKISNWYKVRLENGEVGWLLDTDLEEI